MLHLNSPNVATYKVQPVVIFSILDHYKRRNKELQRVVGALLGEKMGTNVSIKNSFPVLHAEDENGQVTVNWDYYTNMLNLHKRVNPREIVLGWYTTGNKIDYRSSLLNDTGSGSHATYHMTVDVHVTDYRLAIKGYTSHIVHVGDKSVLARLDPVNLQLFATEAEKIGVDALINNQPDDKKIDSPASLFSPYDNLEFTMHKLLDMLETVSGYVTKVLEGKIKGDPSVGRAIANALAAIPRLDSESWNENIQDTLMIVYLTNLTRTQLALANKINSYLE